MQLMSDRKHELNAIGEPDVHLDNTEALEKFGEEPISFQVNVEVLPKLSWGTTKASKLLARFGQLPKKMLTRCRRSA